MTRTFKKGDELILTMFRKRKWYKPWTWWKTTIARRVFVSNVEDTGQINIDDLPPLELLKPPVTVLPMTYWFRCPFCNFEWPDPLPGQAINCPKCDREMRVEGIGNWVDAAGKEEKP